MDSDKQIDELRARVVALEAENDGLRDALSQQMADVAAFSAPAAEFGRSRQTDLLAAALAAAQGAFPEIPRNREVEVRLRDGKSYKFRYATLDAIVSGARKALADNGLAVAQIIEGDTGLKLKTVLLHSSGQWLMSTVPLATSGGPQEFGSILSYMRRYILSSLLGIASQDDDDGNVAAGTEFEVTELPTVRLAKVVDEIAEHRDAPGMATQKQLDFIWSLARKLGWTAETLKEHLLAKHKIASSKEMTRGMASDVIEFLRASILDKGMAGEGR